MPFQYIVFLQKVKTFCCRVAAKLTNCRQTINCVGRQVVLHCA